MVPRNVWPALLLLLAGACAEQDPRLSVRGLGAVDKGSVGGDAGGACPGVSKAGCCAGTGILRYCASGKVVIQTCKGGQQCGWNLTFGLYACGNSGSADPAGANPWACPSPDGGVDSGAPDAAGAPDLGGCGGLSYAGCCAGQVLRFCAGGQTLSMDCASNPSCGWNASSGFYSCGTNGTADPGGKYPKACPPSADAGSSDLGGDGPAPDLATAAPDLPGADGPAAPDRSRPNEGFVLLPDTAAPGDVALLAERGPGELSVGLDVTGFEGGAGDLGPWQDPDADEGGCACDVQGGPVGWPPALFLFLLFGGRRRVGQLFRRRSI